MFSPLCCRRSGKKTINTLLSLHKVLKRRVKALFKKWCVIFRQTTESTFEDLKIFIAQTTKTIPFHLAYSNILTSQVQKECTHHQEGSFAEY